MLRQFVYSSHANPETFQGDLAEILHCARRNNPELGITGVLILAGEGPGIVFIQALEGEPHHLDLLVDAILADHRHSDISILLDHEVSLRAFPDWSMGDMVVPCAAADAGAVEGRVVEALRAFAGPSARSFLETLAA